MKKTVTLTLSSFLLWMHAFTQSLSINTDGSTAHASAILDVKSTVKGMLIPRMAAAERDAIATPAKGLLVFVDTDSSFYYYSSGWKKLLNSDEGWKITGNAGTTGNNFVGTTDFEPLRFRVFNNNAGYLDYVRQNIAYGSFSLNGITSGTGNTGIGYASLPNNTSGDGNVGVGIGSLEFNRTGLFNTGIGAFAGLGLRTGSDNTCIGYGADVLDTALIAATAIGAGAKVSLSNSLVLGQAITNVGIGTDAPHGQLQLGNSNPNTNRKIILYESANNDHQFYGLGINPNMLRLQVDNVISDFAFFSGAGTSASTELVRIKGTGLMGIGISNPAQKLDVNGKAVVRDSLGIGITSPNAPLQFKNLNGRKVVLFEDLANDHRYYGFGIETSAVRYQVSDVVDDHVFYAGTSSTTSNELVRIKGNGRVGIGVTVPVQKLDVNGNAAIHDSLGVGTTNPLLRLDVAGKAAVRDSLGVGTTSPHAQLQFANLAGRKIVMFEDGVNDHQYYGLAIDPSTLRFQSSSEHAFFIATSASSSYEAMRIKSNGAVGIGSATFNEKLNVNGAVKISDGGYTGLTHNAATPVPAGGAGTLVYSNGHFFGWNGTQWKQLDN